MGESKPKILLGPLRRVPDAPPRNGPVGAFGPTAAPRTAYDGSNPSLLGLTYTMAERVPHL